ncbi:hypothetical protein PQU92_08900 [Asticcacaulis sp. BYS171W]|uniref:DUF5666 domain-containing protein n=1 Tax=Asticcacaulis aquaticus TaxID=2984212 RepID=A0ABT5HVC9_9CAUL|nr:hypothetical protein [Asticcacaulis aquaticus]MDC7683391.1 hypothetical protein [Asticcacaulis aquaticus]
MRKLIFLGGLAVGLVVGLSVPVWADNDSPRVTALEARISALEAKVGNDPENKRIALSGSQSLTGQIGKVIDLNAGDEIRLTTGRASLVMKKDGQIALKGGAITIEGQRVEVRDASNPAIKGSKIGDN